MGLTAPSLRRFSTSASRNFIWVAHIGSSTSTMSVALSNFKGRTWLATDSPTSSSQRLKTVTVVSRSPPRSDFNSFSILLEMGVGSGLFADNLTPFNPQNSLWCGCVGKDTGCRNHYLAARQVTEQGRTSLRVKFRKNIIKNE